MAFPLVAQPKERKGAAWLASKERSRERKAAEDKVMREVRKEDGQCRRPDCAHRTKKPRLECAHREHRGMGGNPKGDRTEPHKLMTLCFIDHAEYDRGDLDFEPLTDKGTRGPCAWYRANTETGEMEHFATEKSVGISESRKQT